MRVHKSIALANHLIDSIKISISGDKHSIRILDDEDNREKGVNEKCMEIDGIYLYDLRGLANIKNEDIQQYLGTDIEFKFCKNVEKLLKKSSKNHIIT